MSESLKNKIIYKMNDDAFTRYYSDMDMNYKGFLGL